MYLDDIAAAIRARVPKDRMPAGNTAELFRLYAVLLRVKGRSVTRSDIHDVWSAWTASRDGEHVSLVKYEELPHSVKAEDEVFVVAVRQAAEALGNPDPSRPEFADVLFPSGPPREAAEAQQAFELYKIMVQSSEGLVSRRLSMNTFFLTMNGALLTASGLIVQNSADQKLGALGIAVLAVAGIVLCGAWRSLITSFGQLNRGKFKVINTIEKHLKAAIYAAEWEALGQGKDPKIYRSFTSREIWVPTALFVLHAVTCIAAILVSSGCIKLR